MRYARARRTQIQIAVNKFNNRSSVKNTKLNLVVAPYAMVIWLCETTLQQGTE
jgi:hypothetical protein